MSATASASTTKQSTDMVSNLLTQALSGAFDSMKGKVTANVQENGEEYLHQAVEKIKESTAGVVAWAKENPVKTALAVAALAAVSTFLVRTMTAPSEEEKPAAAKAKSGSRRKASVARATR